MADTSRTDSAISVSTLRVPPPRRVARTGIVTAPPPSPMGPVVAEREMLVGSWSSSWMTTSAGRAVMVPGTVPVTLRVSLPSTTSSSSTPRVMAAVADIPPAGMVRVAVADW